VRRLLLAAIAATAVGSVFAADERVAVGRAAPDFALRAVTGPNVRLSEQRGEVVVIAFWSSRCNPCRTHLAELATRLSVGEAPCFVELGAPQHEIVRVAKEQGVDLIVVGSHGRHGLQLLLGSTANGVLHLAACDVLAVRV
jgi:nucleotide-binding universal stress UspA family protein